MKRYFFLLLLVTSLLNAQTVLEFNNLNPKWVHISQTPNDNKFTTHIPLHTMVKDDALYLTHVILSENYYSGSLLEKIDMNSGNMDWQFIYNVEGFKNREYPQPPFFRQNDDLILPSYRQIPTNEDYFWWDIALLAHRTIDVESGNVIDSFIDDENGKKITMPISTFSQIDPLIVPYGDDFQYLRANSQINSTIFDSKANVILDTVVHFPRPLSFIVSNSTKKVYKGHIYVFNKIRGQNGDYFNMLHVLDQNLDFIRNIDVTRFIQKMDKEFLYAIDDSSFIIRSIKYEGFDENRTVVKEIYYLFDLEGNHMEHIEVDRKNDLPWNYSDFQIIKIQNSKRMLALAVKKESDNVQNLWVLKSDGFGNLDTLKQTKPKVETDEFYINQLSQMENNDILVSFDHRYEVNSDSLIYQTEWMLFSNEELDLYMTADELESDFEMSIYPNPSSGLIQINLLDDCNPKWIRFINTLGHIKEMKFSSRINTSILPNGFYEIQILDDERLVIAKEKIVLN